jgi:CheY-like chemotaxis protein
MVEQRQSTTSAAHGGARDDMRRILVVDDSGDSREILAEFFQLQGHQVRTAADGFEALKMVNEFRPEIVFVDISMPRMDGFELCTRLRSHPLTSDAAVFALTAGLYERQTPSSALAQFDAYLRKPAEFEVIEQLVDTTTRRLQAQPMH